MTILNVKRFAATLLAAALPVLTFSLASNARAEDLVTVVVMLKNDIFTPAEVKVAAGRPFTLKVINQDPIAAEIEAKDLKIEKVMAGNSEITVTVRALEPGRYLFVNEYKEDTVKGFVVAQ